MLTHLLRAFRWHWWTDGTMLPEATLLLRSLGWLVQVARSNPTTFRSDVFLRILAFSSQAFWLALLTILMLLIVVAYLSASLTLRVIGALAYIFWWAFVAYILIRLADTSVSIPDAVVSGLIAFWLLIRLARRAGLHRSLARHGHPSR